MSRPLVVAHRGNSVAAPENTLVAIASAVLVGADMVEIDVHEDADHEGVVIHDGELARTTAGTGRVSEMSSGDVTALDAGSWMHPAFSGVRVPTFAEVVDLLAPHEGVGLLLELKGPWSSEGVRRVAALLEDSGMTSRVVVLSLNTDTMRTVHREAPALRRCVVDWQIGEEQWALVDELEAQVCIAQNVLEDSVLEEVRRRGLQAFVWIYPDNTLPDEWRRAVKAGPDAIITDAPDRLRGWLDCWEGVG